jgi:hypothetical protein
MTGPASAGNHPALRKAEEHFLRESGVLAGTFKHLGSEDREQVTVEAISTEAIM